MWPASRGRRAVDGRHAVDVARGAARRRALGGGTGNAGRRDGDVIPQDVRLTEPVGVAAVGNRIRRSDGGRPTRRA